MFSITFKALCLYFYLHRVEQLNSEGLLCLKSPRLVSAQHLIGPSYSTPTFFIRPTHFTLYQTVYWFNKLFIDLKRPGMFLLSVSLSRVLPFSLLVSALNFLSYLWWQTKHLKGEDSGYLSRWQSTLALHFTWILAHFVTKKACRGLFLPNSKWGKCVMTQ